MKTLSELIQKYGEPEALVDHWDENSQRFAILGFDEIYCKNLEELDAPEYLQDAGLFHSIYGTASFKHQSTNDRNKVIELIWEKAEEIVYWFCIIDKPRTTKINKLEEGQLKNDLKLLNYANNNEQDDAKKEESRLDFYNNVWIERLSNSNKSN